MPAATEEDLQDRDDEKPTVVILESEKVSEEEAKEFIKTLGIYCFSFVLFFERLLNFAQIFVKFINL